MSQANLLAGNGTPLPPVTGANWEGGVKWAPRGGRLNISLAGFRIQKTGFAIGDNTYPFTDNGAGIRCCYMVDPADQKRTQVSTGLDLEIAGELRRGWQVAAGYTYNETTYDGPGYGTVDGQTFLSIQPLNVYKFWTSYDFGAAGHTGALSGLTLSGGFNGQSSAYRAGTICVRLDPNVPPSATGFQPCAVGGRESFSFTVPPYAVFAAMMNYRLSRQWSLSANIDNIFDKKYYQTVSDSVISGHWYGTPRSFTLSLRGRY